MKIIKNILLLPFTVVFVLFELSKIFFTEVVPWLWDGVEMATEKMIKFVKHEH